MGDPERKAMVAEASLLIQVEQRRWAVLLYFIVPLMENSHGGKEHFVKKSQNAFMSPEPDFYFL